MKLFIIITIFFSVSALYAQSNQFSESHLKAAENLLKTINLEKQLDKSIKQILEVQARTNPILEKFQDEIEMFLKKYMSFNNLKNEYIKIYVEVYSEQEIIELTKFYTTPLGKKTAEVAPKIAIKGAELGQKIVQDNMVELQEIIEKAMEDEKEKENSEKTNSLNNYQTKLGGKAPVLDISSWIKGTDVIMETGKVYVVEFWATWCPPCRSSIPHLTEVQQKFKDKGVVIIGISSETSETVKPFVEEMGEKMEYVVAIDNDKKTSNGYMKPFDVKGIPHAFVIDKEGNIAWHGHPASGLEEAIEKAL